ncbi:hypothetical protein ASPACDRAFT_63343 [Aspergillus aculeatus ATCC 16872]|uniref:Uncharacterized protein n=1 Tax=Aspergillus aculeatus (strain ATCC 16872 / CBS 172.66 / WB 5094) TaxID=690307 RepID=A0A1L9WJS7_ASPA1|nr:uncharacterized protein ASPACDRAFT_63343 [Aspergillus aculeatus ATCC 16872]OJJ96407.1 hypothetical protein ASPACDRAFT_63343 [Aspergillus aculeatus ATCC 16872]
MDHELEKGPRHDEEAQSPESRQRQLDLPVEAASLWPRLYVALFCVTFLTLGVGGLSFLVTRKVYGGERDARLREEGGQGHEHLQARWGGFAERPMDNQCYRQERTAILLSAYLGLLGVDQWYAHHWALAVFKMLAWLLLFIVRAASKVFEQSFLLQALLAVLIAAIPVWWMADFIMWTVGGVYGTPGCPGGSGSWRY